MADTTYQLAAYAIPDGFERGPVLVDIAVDRAGLEMLIGELTRLLDADETGRLEIRPTSFTKQGEPRERVSQLVVSYEPGGWPSLAPRERSPEPRS